MNKKHKVLLAKEYFPSQAASNEEKASNKYGLQVANSIQSDWMRREGGGSSRFDNHRQEFHRLRLYARGEQSTQKYKDEFAIDGDLSYLNLDWTPVPIVPKFVDIVVNGQQHRAFEIKCQAQDETSTLERKRYFDTLKGEMENKEALLQLEALTGQDVFENDKDKLPETEDEYMLHSELGYKQSIEIASELAIKQTFDSNQYPELVKRRVDEDIVVIGIGAAKHSFYPNEGIKLDYVDPAELVYSHNDSPYFDEASYFGEVKRINILDLKKQFPHLTEDDLERAKQVGRGFYDYQGLNNNNDQSSDDHNLIEILYFCWKTTETVVHKVKKNVNGGDKAIRRDDDFNPPSDGDGRYKFKKTEQVLEVIYEGAILLGDTEELLKWEKQKNMVRPKSSYNSVTMPYVVASPKYYSGRIESVVSRITKYADLIQLQHLKLQQVIQRMTPSGVYLDVDGLAEVDLGNGNNYNPREALNMYMQTGSVIGRSKTQDDDLNHGRIPIQELPGSTGQQIRPLIELYEFYLKQIRDMTGVNEARDGTSPDERAAVGVQKLAAANSNVATRHILDAGIYITTRLAEGVSLRIADVLEYSPMKKNFINAIGKYNTGVLNEIKDLHLYDFGITLEIEPDIEEKALLENNIQQAIQSGQIYIEDAISIREVNNLKVANQLLRVLRRKKEKLDQEQQASVMQQNTQSQTQIAQATKQAEAEAYQIKSESEISVEQAKSQFSIQKLNAEKDAEKELLLFKHQLQIDIMNMQTQGNLVQGAQKIQGQQMVEDKKAKTSAGGGKQPISINNNSNTIDGQLVSGGLL